MSRKLYEFREEQVKLKWHDKHTDKIRLKSDNITVKLQPWITEKKY